MIERVICNKEDLVAIADVVRATTGTTNTYSVKELSDAIVACGGFSGGDELPDVTDKVDQAVPIISVDENGLITATATQEAGTVAAGSVSSTKQLATQAAQTITPGTSNQTIASGTYLTGTQTIEGDANLVPSNIANGVSIFGVTGTMTAGESTGSGMMTVSFGSSVTSDWQYIINGEVLAGRNASISIPVPSIVPVGEYNYQFLMMCQWFGDNSINAISITVNGETKTPYVSLDALYVSTGAYWGCTMWFNSQVFHDGDVVEITPYTK